MCIVKVYFCEVKITIIYKEKINRIYHITNSELKDSRKKLIHNSSVGLNFSLRSRFNHFIKPTFPLSSLILYDKNIEP